MIVIILILCLAYGALILLGAICMCKVAARPMPRASIRVTRRPGEGDDELLARSLEKSPAHCAACENSVNEWWGDE